MAEILLEDFKINWVKWTKIGSLDFTVDHSNVAGERPLDWSGWIYDIRKLGSKFVVYGESGVSILTPSGVKYGLNTIYGIGIKGKNAIIGNGVNASEDSIHYFIDTEGQLWSLSDELQLLDYSEYLSVLTNPVLSWDIENHLLYICDGIYGFVYSPRSGSLGSGPINITGIGSQEGVRYVVASAVVVTPRFEICTDIYDLGMRGGKTIKRIIVGTDLTTPLSMSVDYRSSKSEAFSQTEWFLLNDWGWAQVPVYGHEFRFRFKTTVAGYDYEYFELDYIIVEGITYDYKTISPANSIILGSH